MEPNIPRPMNKITVTLYTPEERNAMLLDDRLPRNMLARQKGMNTIMTEIDEIYDQISVLSTKHDNSKSDIGLESQIAELLERLQVRQKQEVDLMRTMLSSPPSGAIAIGLSILESVDELRAKYGHTPTSNTSANRPN